MTTHTMITSSTTGTMSLKATEPVLSSSFLALPAEIRNDIYTHLFRDAKLGIATIHNGSPFPFCGSFCDCAFPWHIVNTCRQVRREATAVLLAATTLEVTNRVNKTSMLPEHYVASIPRAIFLDAKLLPQCPVKLGKFRALRILELRNVTIWCKYYEDSYLENDDANETMFDLAMFNLGRISQELLKICRDPARTFKVLLGCQYVVHSVTHETVQAVIDVDAKKVLHKTKGATIRERNAWAGFY